MAAGRSNEGAVVVGAAAVAAGWMAWKFLSLKQRKRRDVRCLIFDLDDTLYPVTNGFTKVRERHSSSRVR